MFRGWHRHLQNKNKDETSVPGLSKKNEKRSLRGGFGRGTKLRLLYLGGKGKEWFEEKDMKKVVNAEGTLSTRTRE